MFPLEKLCLDIIAQNFERFYCAFTILKDENLMRNLLFLQRRFSAQLLTALHTGQILKEEFFELLISEHLNLLVGNWFNKSCHLTSMESIFCRLSNLTRICISNCDDGILENIAKFCPKIIEIDVKDSNVTDGGLKYLYEKYRGIIPCPQLKNLFIEESRVTDKGVECLIRNLPSLERIYYETLPQLLHSIHKENLPNLGNAQSYNLVELDLLNLNKQQGYFDILKACFTVCPKLESVAAYASKEEEFNVLTNSKLKKLHLECFIKDIKIDINNFLKLAGCNLTCLKICNQNISVTTCEISLPLLAVHCPVLEEFYAQNVSFLHEDDFTEVVFPSLTKCCFSRIDTSSTKAICLLLVSSPKLESVSIRFFGTFLDEGRLHDVRYSLPLELISEILMWCKSPSAKLVEFVQLDLEKKIVEDILLHSPNLEAMFLYQCDFDIPDMKSFLYSFIKKLHIKTRIFLKIHSHRRQTEPIDMLIFDHNSLSLQNNSSRNLENHLREEHKCLTVYDYLFTETAFVGNYGNKNHDWENNWDIITF